MHGIDGLRAVAVAAVFVYHAKASWLPGGFFGVDVFFVISGYLITSLLLAELESSRRIALGGFWFRRARRLLPAVFLLIGVCLLLGATVERGKLGLRGDALASIFYVANWHFILGHESYFAQFGRPPLLRHLWSLAVEEQFYVLWPVLFLIGMRFCRRALPFVVGAAAIGSTALMWALYAPGSDTSRVFYGTDTRAAPLLVGALLAFVWKPLSATAPGRRRTQALDILGIAALGAVGYAFVAMHDYDPAVYRGGFLLLACCAAVALAATAHNHTTLGRLLGNPALRWLGERSYAIYLWHWPVLAFTRPGVDLRLAPWSVLALQVGLTLTLADLSYRFVESPIRSGALRRVRLRNPWPVSQARTPIAVATLAVGALLALASVTPDGVRALPPGFTEAALASSQRAAATPLAPVRHGSIAASPRAAGRVGSTGDVRATQRIPTSGPILAVGDSVMLGASAALKAKFGSTLSIDAAVSRQVGATIDRLNAYRVAGQLPKRVVVHVGDNGPVWSADWERLKAALSAVPLVVLVNVCIDRSWQDEVNREMRQAVAGWRHATIADWHGAGAGRGTRVDGVHTTALGARMFAAVIAHALRSPEFRGITR